LQRDRFLGDCIALSETLWKLNWFLRDFGYDPDLLSRDQLHEKAGQRHSRSGKTIQIHVR